MPLSFATPTIRVAKAAVRHRLTVTRLVANTQRTSHPMGPPFLTIKFSVCIHATTSNRPQATPSRAATPVAKRIARNGTVAPAPELAPAVPAAAAGVGAVPLTLERPRTYPQCHRPQIPRPCPQPHPDSDRRHCCCCCYCKTSCPAVRCRHSRSRRRTAAPHCGGGGGRRALGLPFERQRGVRGIAGL